MQWILYLFSSTLRHMCTVKDKKQCKAKPSQSTTYHQTHIATYHIYLLICICVFYCSFSVLFTTFAEPPNSDIYSLFRWCHVDMVKQKRKKTNKRTNEQKNKTATTFTTLDGDDNDDKKNSNNKKKAPPSWNNKKNNNTFTFETQLLMKCIQTPLCASKNGDSEITHTFAHLLNAHIHLFWITVRISPNAIPISQPDFFVGFFGWFFSLPKSFNACDFDIEMSE